MVVRKVVVDPLAALATVMGWNHKNQHRRERIMHCVSTKPVQTHFRFLLGLLMVLLMLFPLHLLRLLIVK